MDQAEPVAQPFDRGAGDEDRAFQRIGPLAVDRISDGREQAILRLERFLAGVEQGETAGAIGGFHVAAGEAGLADHRRLLVARHAADRHRTAEQALFGLAEERAIVLDLGQHGFGHAEHPAQIGIPLALVDVVEQGARRVGGVGGVDLAAGQPPQQEAVDRAESELAFVGAGAGAGDIVEDPAQLGAGEIGVEDQPGLGADLVLIALRLQLGAEFRGPAILPHDRLVDRFPGRAVPHHHRLALVGDADRLDRAAILFGHLAQGRLRVAPDILDVMLDPAMLGIMLLEFLAGDLARHALGVEAHRAGRCGALVDGQQNLLGHGLSSHLGPATGLSRGRNGRISRCWRPPPISPPISGPAIGPHQ